MPAIASISKIFLFKAFSLSSSRSVKDQTLIQRCNFPVIRESGKRIPLINDCMVFAKMPEITGIGVRTYLSGTGTWEDGAFVRSDLDTSHLISALRFCSDEGCVDLGRSYHGLIAKIGLDGDEFVNTSLIDMYAKSGGIDSAVMVFNQMHHLDVAACNCLISGYANCGLFDEAFRFFMKYESLGNKPNSYTYSSMLAICRILSALEEGKQLHAQVVKMQYLSETAVSNALLTMYCECKAMADAESVFEWIPQRNTISWTAIINGLYQHEDFEKAMRKFCLMRESGIEPNEYTFTIALASCGSMKSVDSGRLLHALVIRKGMALGEFVGTAIVDMYSELGLTDDAKKQFREMGNVASKVTRNALIKGLVQNEKTNEALDVFREMVRKDAACDEFTFSIILRACASLPSFSSCQQIHAWVAKAKLDTNTHVGSSLIEAYTGCGIVEDAEKVFSRISAPDDVSWNSMIKAYSQNGNPRRAMSLFRRMIMKGFRPTGSTFLAVLSACSHSGKIQDGHEIFQSMVREFGLLPEQAHYSCMVDLLGRSGQIERALDFISNMPIKPTASIWRPLLAACRCHDNLKVAESVAKHILAMDPNDATVYVTLSNMYTEAGLLENAKNQRRLMKLKKVTKEPGRSWIEVNNKIHKFFSHDRTHPESEKIYDKLKQVAVLIKGTADSANADSLQVKEDYCLYHSEKLAVCFGLTSLPAGKPVRVFKNLRVCTDCHMFMKFASMVTDRVIILSDNYRFHHFNKGCCSCGDYW
ncbi:putative Tetratricopeptide repeat (TPR)-like superfamily protein [Hibiscus syriacus]|uniref:Tetratricopeptide repeat (TPR)-like superfamily protein n=1 Tax=Hibiscus syriacus TaxID=106335 RepID=A0A6A2X4A0_HIBSY|nr:pentatricopeptide repeat-containing protein At2g03880, mitochondrial-like [Hibiscus syriacus]KAE8656796.1 putative Tetratricopeptide repeat (TPR)-like superfamily protein [Hibiscus syriacus]